MMIYDKESQILKVQKVEPIKLEIDLLRDQKDSFAKYMNETIHHDVDYICEYIMSKINVKNLTAKATVGSLYSTRSGKEIKNKGDQYYPVNVTFYINGNKSDTVELIRIPYMDDFCVLNVGGSPKVLLSELKSAEEISYTENKRMLNVILPQRMISITASNTAIKFKLNKNSNIAADKLLMGFISHDGLDIDITKFFKNSYILSTMTDLEFKTEGVVSDEISKTNIIERYRSEAYKLGKLRKSLNAKLTIDKAIGETLSQDIYLPRSNRTLLKGEVVTLAVMTELKYNLINEVYIRAIPKIKGWYLTESVTIFKVKRSATMTDLLKSYLIQYSKYNYVPQDTEVIITLDAGTQLTDDIIKTMFDAGIESISCSRAKSLNNSRTIYFEQEIVGNGTARLGDFMEDIPEHLSADSYTFFKDKEDPYTVTELDNPEYLTTYDLIALVSLIARIQTMPEMNETSNRDLDFLKKVNLINETFSESLRTAVDIWFRPIKSYVERFLLHSIGNRDPFFGLNKEWFKIMRDKKLLRETEGVNPISLLTQANRVVTVTQSSDSVPVELRSLAMGFYGRICPYETPAGKNIGLLNTLAIGCRIEDGIVYTPYHRVLKTNKGYRLDSNLTWLSASDEFDQRIGDILNIKMDPVTRIIENNKVTARVPAPIGAKEKTTVTTLSAHDLNYVNVLPEQHLSPTAMLIPFAASDDGARVSFGLNLIRQSIYVQHSEVPLVTTSMYKNVFDYSDTYIFKAKKDGVVIAIESDTLILQYDDEANETIKYIPETRVTNDAVTVMNYKIRPGDRFKAGDILIDSDVSKEGYFTPGVNLLTAYIPWDGYNYEDAVVLCEDAHHKFVSVFGHRVEKKLSDKENEIIRVSPGNYFKYIPEGGIITSIERMEDVNSRRERVENMYAHKASGILYDIKTEVNQEGDRLCVAQLLGFNTLRQGDKMSGRHGNKGVNSLKERNSNMPMFLNGVIVEAVLNPCGVVSRMNIGQELEGHAGFIAYLLGIRIESDPFNGATIDDIKMLMKYVHELANNPDPRAACAKFLHAVPKELHERAIERHAFIREWEGCFLPDGSAPMYNQMTGTMFEYPITFGMPYLLKIVQEVDDKMHARAGVLEEEYSMLENQPTKGSSRGGGQAMGEMEGHVIFAHGAAEFYREMANEKSDNVEGRIDLMLDALDQPTIYQDTHTTPRTVDKFRYYLEVMGVKTETDDLPSVDYDDIVQRTQYDARALARQVDVNRQKVSAASKAEKHKATIRSLDEL